MRPGRENAQLKWQEAILARTTCRSMSHKALLYHHDTNDGNSTLCIQPYSGIRAIESNAQLWLSILDLKISSNALTHTSKRPNVFVLKLGRQQTCTGARIYATQSQAKCRKRNIFHAFHPCYWPHKIGMSWKPAKHCLQHHHLR